MNSGRHHGNGHWTGQNQAFWFNPLDMFEQTLALHQQMLRGAIISDELARSSLRTFRKQLEYAGTFGGGFTQIGKQNSDFFQQMTAAAANWQKTSELGSSASKRPSAH